MSAPTITWLILVAATLGSFTVAEYLPQRQMAVAAIFLVAAIKVRLILHQFMDLRSAPWPWRVTLDVWTMGCAAMISGLSWYALTV